MKIRHGFVSNSSSTSFAVHISNYPTVRDVAVVMMEIRNSDWDHYDDAELAQLTIKHAETGDERTYKEIKSALEFPSENQRELQFMINSDRDKDIPTAFATTNYNTFLMKSGEYIFISTCHNHAWYDIPHTTPQKDKFDMDDFKSLWEGESSDCVRDIMEEIEYNLEYMCGFWWPRIDKVITMFRHFQAQKCKCDVFSGMVMCDGKLVCPRCDLGLGNIL